MLVIYRYPCLFRFVIMVKVMKNYSGVFDYIFLMSQFVWGYTRLWGYWFFKFSSREWRRWRPGAYAARVQITKSTLFPPSFYLHSPPSLSSLSTAPFSIPSFPSPSQLSSLTSVFLPLFHQPFIMLFFPSPLLSLAPLPLLFSPPISVPFSVLV